MKLGGCRIEGCESRGSAFLDGLCYKHYKQAVRDTKKRAKRPKTPHWEWWQKKEQRRYEKARMAVAAAAAPARIARVARGQVRMAKQAQAVVTLTQAETLDILGRGCFFSSLGDCSGPLSVAHDIPRVEGGNTTFANLFCLCRRHNSMMGTRSLAEILTQALLFPSDKKGAP